MGLIKSALGSARRSDQANNGFNSPQFPYFNRNQNSYQRNDYDYNSGSRRRRIPSPMNNRSFRATHFSSIGPNPDDETQTYHSRYTTPSRRPEAYESSYRNSSPATNEMGPSSRDEKNRYHIQEQPQDSPPPYEQRSHDRQCDTPSNSSRNVNYAECRGGYRHERTSPQDDAFRPLALPQITHGKGQPFLRAYSNELRYYNISEQDFLRTVDTINVAIIPNPEAQIAQKAASIASWFIPGAASIGLMAGQIGVGLGAALGYSTMVARALSKANLELFVPNGLEICICSTENVDTELGLPSYSQQQRRMDDGTPEGRLASYGDLLAPLSTVLLPLRANGRNDPIAMIGRDIGQRDAQRKIDRAQKRMAKGKSKNMDALEGEFKWLMVRRATPGAIQRWQEVLQHSRVAEQQQADSGSRPEYTR